MVLAAGLGGGHPNAVVDLALIVGLMVAVGAVLLGVLALVGGGGFGSGVNAGRVILIVGKMGSGKSYFAVRLAAKRLRGGATVAVNFTMTLDSWCRRHGGGWATVQGCRTCAQARGMAGRLVRVSSWADVYQCRQCVVVIDEAHNWAPAIAGRSLPDEIREFCTQARHYGVDLVLISQHETRVNTQFRLLMNVIYVCHAFFGVFFVASCYEPEYVRKSGKHMGRTYYRLRRRWAGLYRTHEIIAVPLDAPRVGKEKASGAVEG